MFSSGVEVILKEHITRHKFASADDSTYWKSWLNDVECQKYQALSDLQ